MINISFLRGRRTSMALNVFLVLSSLFAQSTEKKLSLCDVANNPERYNNREITMKAQYESDGVEREGLSDPTCGGVNIGLVMLQKTKGKGQLQAALHGGYPGTLDKTVVGTFTGVFHWEPHGHPPMLMTVRAMRDFSVHAKSLPSKAPQ